MSRKEKDRLFANLPVCAAEFIKLVIKKMRYRRKVRADVQAELVSHFEDELRGCKSDEEKEQKARQLIEQFGDVKLLGVLLRRAKKRCRPLWRTMVARTFQAVGILILCLIIYTAWFLTGKPSISVDYLALLNQMNRPQVADVDNAWPHYEKAINLLVKPSEDLKKTAAFENYKEAVYRRLGNLSKVEQERVRKWVEQNEAAWREFAAGSEKLYCYREIEYNTEDQGKWLWNVPLPHLAPLRRLSKLGVWRSRIQIEQGNIQQALEDCLVIARAGSHWQGRIGCLIEQLVGLAICRLGNEEMLNIVATGKLSAADLKQLQQQLVEIYSRGFPLIDIEGERLMLLDTVQHIFTDGGLGGGHLIPSELIFIMEFTGGASDFVAELMIPFTAGSMVHARRDETVAKVNEMYDRLSEIVKMTPYERRIRNVNSEEMVSALSKYRYFLIGVFMPAADRVSDMSWRGKILYEASLTVLALQRWQSENDEYPETLDELIAGDYLRELPMDPYSDKPMVYKKTKEDFLLYSVGPNFKDDNGEPGRDRNEKPKLWGDESDAVFWPIAKN